MKMPDWSLARVRRIRVPADLKRPLLVATAVAAVALLTLGGLPVLRDLYAGRWIAAEHYHVVFASLCIVPAAATHVAAILAGARGTSWWFVWLPGVAVYAAFPWQEGGAWRPLWIFGHARDWGRTIFLHWDTAGPFVFNSFGAFIAMLMVAMVACGRLWAGAAKAVARAGSEALGPEDAEDALPGAAWASAGEIVERFSDPGGIVLGELTDPSRDSPNFAPDRPWSWGRQGGGHLITMSPEKGNGHVLVTSQASGYKSTGLVIPNILTYDGPIVVFDPKCELHARTRHARKRMNFKPVVIDERNGFDPARMIAALAKGHPSAYLRMAKMVIPKGHGGIENSKYFKDAATNLFCALLAHYGGTGSMSILQDIARILACSPNDAHATLKDELPESPATFVENEINALKGMDPKFWASIKTEITNQLLFCSIPDVQRFITMKPGSELPAQVVDPRCDIFLNIPQNVAEDFAPMLRLMLGSMLTAAQLIEINEKPRARRLFLIDEAAKLGAMDILENIRDRGRSLGLHLMLFYQTPGEIERLWGRAGMTSWRDGCSATVMGPVSSRTSAQDLSAMMGTRMLRLKTESKSSSSPVMSPMSGSVSASEQEQLRDVALITPTAISQLPPHASIVTATGMKPMLVSKAIWFTRPDMKDRVRDTEEITGELPVAESQKALTKRLEEMTQVDEETARWASVSREDLVAMQRRNMDDDSEPAILRRRARPDEEGLSLSERARAKGPRHKPEEDREPRSVNGGRRVAGDSQHRTRAKSAAGALRDPGKSRGMPFASEVVGQVRARRDRPEELSGALSKGRPDGPGTSAAEEGARPSGVAREKAARERALPDQRPEIATGSRDIDPAAIETENDIEQRCPAAESEPAPAASDTRMASVPRGGTGGAGIAATEGKGAAHPGAAKDGQAEGAGATVELEGGSETNPADEGDGDDAPESAVASRRPAEAGANDPGAIEIEEDFEPHWSAAGPAPARSEPDEQLENVSRDGEDEKSWTSVDRAEFMSLSASGMPLARIADEMGTSVASVRAWLKSQDAHGLVPGGVADVEDSPDGGEPGGHGPGESA